MVYVNKSILFYLRRRIEIFRQIGRKKKISILFLFEKNKIKCFLYTIQKRKKIKQTAVMYDTKNTIDNLLFFSLYIGS